MADGMEMSTGITGGNPRRYPFSRHRLDLDPLHAQLRRDEPVCRVQLPYGRPAWLVTSYELVKLVLSDPRFSRKAALAGDNPREDPFDLLQQFPETVLNMDPPEHTRIRRLAGKALTSRRVEQLRPRARQIAAGLIDDMTAAGPPADLVQGYSFAFPASVICELLGIPEGDRRQFRSWTAGMSSTSTASPQEQQGILLKMFGYFGELFAQRRKERGEDLLTALIRARDRDDRLTETELVFLGLSLLVGGRDTTAHQITNVMYTLLRHRRQLDQLTARPELIPGAVEEVLRYIVLGNAVNPRIATVDVQLGDVLVRAGEPVLTAMAAANRDPSVFDRPEELDITREPHPHLAFGHGPHFCPGAQLARMELQTSVETILSRLTGLRIAVPESDLTWQQGTMMRGLTALPLSWDTGFDSSTPRPQIGASPE
jgi:cytochrome P450